MLKISKDSWHFEFINRWGFIHPDYTYTVCEYINKFIGALFKSTAVIGITLSLAVLLSLGWYSVYQYGWGTDGTIQHWFIAVMYGFTLLSLILSGSVAFVLLISGSIALIQTSWFKSRSSFEKVLNNEQSFLGALYTRWKDKVCVLVKFE